MYRLFKSDQSTSQIQRKKTVRKRLPACCDCAAPKGCFSPAKSLKPHLVACPACRFSLAYLNANGNEPTARLTLLPLVPAAFFGVHGKDKHKDVEGVSRICYIKNIGIGKIEKLFTNARNAISVPIANGVVPFEDIAFCFPAQKVEGITW